MDKWTGCFDAKGSSSRRRAGDTLEARKFFRLSRIEEPAAIGGLVWMLVSEPGDVAQVPMLSVMPHQQGAMGQATWSF